MVNEEFEVSDEEIVAANKQFEEEQARENVEASDIELIDGDGMPTEIIEHQKEKITSRGLPKEGWEKEFEEEGEEEKVDEKQEKAERESVEKFYREEEKKREKERKELEKEEREREREEKAKAKNKQLEQERHEATMRNLKNREREALTQVGSDGKVNRLRAEQRAEVKRYEKSSGKSSRMSYMPGLPNSLSHEGRTNYGREMPRVGTTMGAMLRITNQFGNSPKINTIGGGAMPRMGTFGLKPSKVQVHSLGTNKIPVIGNMGSTKSLKIGNMMGPTKSLKVGGMMPGPVPSIGMFNTSPKKSNKPYVNPISLNTNIGIGKMGDIPTIGGNLVKGKKVKSTNSINFNVPKIGNFGDDKNKKNSTNFNVPKIGSFGDGKNTKISTNFNVPKIGVGLMNSNKKKTKRGGIY